MGDQPVGISSSPLQASPPIMRQKKLQPEVISSFDIFWDNFPKKDGKKKAKEIWNSNRLGAKDLVKILSWLDRALASPLWQHPRNIPDGCRFLRGRTWEYPAPPIDDNWHA